MKTITNKQDALGALRDPAFLQLSSMSEPRHFEDYFDSKYGGHLRYVNGDDRHFGILDFSDDFDEDGDIIGYSAIGVTLAETPFWDDEHGSGKIVVARYFSDEECPFRVSYYKGNNAITEYLDHEIIDDTLGRFKTAADALLGAQLAYEHGIHNDDLEYDVANLKHMQRTYSTNISFP